MLHHDPAAKTHDRIGFTLSMAIALHVAVVLGVGFALQVPKAPSATRMDITLSSYKTNQTILDADFVAQTNQEASGTEHNKKELTTTELAPINNNNVQLTQNQQQIPKRQQNQQTLQLISSTTSDRTTAQPQLQPLKDEIQDLKGQQQDLQRQLEIASLQAKLDREQQVYARMPKIRRATSVATKAAIDAEYLYKWQRRIEAIGNQHYPKQARDQKLVGDVRVLVVIDAEGKLRETRILESSGNPILDSATLRIVRLASPFPAFPPELKKTTDMMEIVRTWEFRNDQLSYSN